MGGHDRTHDRDNHRSGHHHSSRRNGTSNHHSRRQIQNEDSDDDIEGKDILVSYAMLMFCYSQLVVLAWSTMTSTKLTTFSWLP